MIARLALVISILTLMAMGIFAIPRESATAQSTPMPLFLNEVNGWCERDGGCGATISDAGGGYWRFYIADSNVVGRAGCVDMTVPEWVEGYAFILTGIIAEPYPVWSIASMKSVGRTPLVCELVIRRMAD